MYKPAFFDFLLSQNSPFVDIVSRLFSTNLTASPIKGVVGTVGFNANVWPMLTQFFLPISSDAQPMGPTQTAAVTDWLPVETEV